MIGGDFNTRTGRRSDRNRREEERGEKKIEV